MRHRHDDVRSRAPLASDRRTGTSGNLVSLFGAGETKARQKGYNFLEGLSIHSQSLSCPDGGVRLHLTVSAPFLGLEEKVGMLRRCKVFVGPDLRADFDSVKPVAGKAGVRLAEIVTEPLLYFPIDCAVYRSNFRDGHITIEGTQRGHGTRRTRPLSASEMVRAIASDILQDARILLAASAESTIPAEARHVTYVHDFFDFLRDVDLVAVKRESLAIPAGYDGLETYTLRLTLVGPYLDNVAVTEKLQDCTVLLGNRANATIEQAYVIDTIGGLPAVEVITTVFVGCSVGGKPVLMSSRPADSIIIDSGRDTKSKPFVVEDWVRTMPVRFDDIPTTVPREGAGGAAHKKTTTPTSHQVTCERTPFLSTARAFVSRVSVLMLTLASWFTP